MPTLVDLTGQKFGRLTVLFRDVEYQKNHKKGNACWRCQCDCGKQTTVIGSLLKNGHTKSCGCLHSEKAKSNGGWRDLTGLTFGRLHILEEDKEYRIKNNIKAHHCYWKCKCECGNIISVLGNSLLGGATASCGCLISKGEEHIRKLLIKNNIPFETQKTFPTCISDTKTRFRFDFYINNNFLLEFDGEQHFKYSEKGLFTKDKYLKICANDNQKAQWCKEQKIPLKRIPYWELENITIENILDDTFLVKES